MIAGCFEFTVENNKAHLKGAILSMFSLESKHGLTRAILQFDSSQEIRDAANASICGSRIANSCYKSLLILQILFSGKIIANSSG